MRPSTRVAREIVTIKWTLLGRRRRELFRLAALVCGLVIAHAALGSAQAAGTNAPNLLAQARAAWQHRDTPGGMATALDLYGRAIKAGAGFDGL